MCDPYARPYLEIREDGTVWIQESDEVEWRLLGWDELDQMADEALK